MKRRKKRLRRNGLLLACVILFALVLVAFGIAFQSANTSFTHENHKNSDTAFSHDTRVSSHEALPQTLAQKLNLNEHDMKNLVLINFENEVPNEPDTLCYISQLISRDICEYDESMLAVREAGEALSRMLNDGCTQGHGKFILNSAFRSYEAQKRIWDERLAHDSDYGKNPYESPVRAMPPGKSEHETGLAFDILTVEHPFANNWFGTFDDGTWLAQNCHLYGFILRYPEDKTHITGVQYEPWHFRYVGVKAATYMSENNLCLEEFIKILHTAQ
ncbi:MAG: M15 family metallopeptidase [Clostridia bacterium]|nr:M15 family metallopeptidase [Clostridia bacterium]